MHRSGSLCANPAIAAGKIDDNKMVSGIDPMDRTIEAFETLAIGKGDPVKPLIRIGD